MTFGLSASAIGLIGAGTSLVSGLMGSSAASDAASTQAASADKATALQRDIYNQQRSDQAPFRQAGLAAQNKLMTYLGLGGSPGGGASGGTYTAGQSGSLPSSNLSASGPGQVLQNSPTSGTSGGSSLDPAALRAQLLPQFTSQGPMTNPDTGYGAEGAGGGNPTYGPSTVDEAGLQAAINQKMGTSTDQSGGANGTNGASTVGGITVPGGIDSSDPAYGSLNQDFTAQDFQNGQDPGYQFRLDQGLRAVNASAAANGGLYSGAAMKGLNDYAQGQASQEYQAAYNRFQTNRSNKLNPLQSLMGAGQTATNQVGQAGQNYGAQAGANITGAGNATASGIVGSSNALTSGMTGAYNTYNSNNLMNTLMNNSGGGLGGPITTSANPNGVYTAPAY